MTGQDGDPMTSIGCDGVEVFSDGEHLTEFNDQPV